MTNRIQTFKVELRSVLLSMPRGATFRQLNFEFRARVGTDIPYREFGYSHLAELIADLPDVARVGYDHGEERIYGVADASTEHIASLVARQKSKRRGRPASSSAFRFTDSRKYQAPRRFVNSGIQRLSGRLQYPSNVAQQSLSKYPVDVPSLMSLSTDKQPPAVRYLAACTPAGDYSHAMSKDGSLRMGDAKYASSNDFKTQEVPNPVNHLFTGVPSVQPRNVRNDVSELMKDYPGGIELDRFSDAYEKRFGVEIRSRCQAVGGVRQLLQSMTDIVELREVGGQIMVNAKFGCTFFKGCLATKPQPSETCTLPPATTKETLINELIVLLKQFPNGLPVENLSHEYQKVVGKVLPIRELGFSTAESLAGSLPPHHFMLSVSRNGHILNLTSRVQMISPPRKVETCPDDAVGPGMSIPVQCPPPVSKSYVKLCVSNVIHPGWFSVQLVSRECSERLDELMTIMQSTYNHEMGNAYKLPKGLMSIGQLCAALYNNEWHRAYITGIKEKQVQVCYADYGTVGWIDTSLRMLRRKYLELPFQAIRARLADVEPFDGTWSREAKSVFAERVNDRVLFATITNVGQDVSLYLTDRSGQEDLNINNLLIRQKHARYLPEIYEEPSNTAGAIEPAKIQQPSVKPTVSNTSFVPVKDAPVKDAQAVKDAPVKESGDLRMVVADSCCVQLVKLTKDYHFHLIKVDDKAYMASAEVSALLWDEDIVRKKLREINCIHLSKLILLPEEHPDVFELLTKYPIPGVMKNNKPSPILVLYELSSVSEILELFRHPSEQLKMALQQQIDLFNPHDPCWTVAKDDDNDRNSDPELEQELLDKWKHLQNLRKLLYNKLNASDGHEKSQIGDVVEKLKQVELQLNDLEPDVKMIRQKRGPSGDTSKFTYSADCHGHGRIETHGTHDTPTRLAEVASAKDANTSLPPVPTSTPINLFANAASSGVASAMHNVHKTSSHTAVDMHQHELAATGGAASGSATHMSAAMANDATERMSRLVLDSLPQAPLFYGQQNPLGAGVGAGGQPGSSAAEPGMPGNIGQANLGPLGLLGFGVLGQGLGQYNPLAPFGQGLLTNPSGFSQQQQQQNLLSNYLLGGIGTSQASLLGQQQNLLAGGGLLSLMLQQSLLAGAAGLAQPNMMAGGGLLSPGTQQNLLLASLDRTATSASPQLSAGSPSYNDMATLLGINRLLQLSQSGLNNNDAPR